jgi:hypothetical protein
MTPAEASEEAEAEGDCGPDLGPVRPTVDRNQLARSRKLMPGVVFAPSRSRLVSSSKLRRYGGGRGEGSRPGVFHTTRGGRPLVSDCIIPAWVLNEHRSLEVECARAFQLDPVAEISAPDHSAPFRSLEADQH